MVYSRRPLCGSREGRSADIRSHHNKMLLETKMKTKPIILIRVITHLKCTNELNAVRLEVYLDRGGRVGGEHGRLLQAQLVLSP